MIKKIIATSIVLVMLAAVIPVSSAAAGNQKHYNGLVGADSPLYTIKIYIQKMDVFLTFNDTAKLEKLMARADEQVAMAEDAVDANNIAAFNASNNAYLDTMNDMNNTLQSEGVSDTAATDELVPLLVHHQQVFYGIANNTTTPAIIQGRTMYTIDQAIKIKNGMPFYYDAANSTAYFIPPGKMKKIEQGIINGSKVPPGLKNKGYKNPKHTIENGSTVWPWDEVPYPSSTKLHGNGNGNKK